MQRSPLCASRWLASLGRFGTHPRAQHGRSWRQSAARNSIGTFSACSSGYKPAANLRPRQRDRLLETDFSALLRLLAPFSDGAPDVRAAAHSNPVKWTVLRRVRAVWTALHRCDAE